MFLQKDLQNDQKNKSRHSKQAYDNCIQQITGYSKTELIADQIKNKQDYIPEQGVKKQFENQFDRLLY